MKSICTPAILFILHLTFASCHTKEDQTANSVAEISKPDKLKITWGSNVLFADSDTLYLFGYNNTSDSTKTFRKMKMRATLYDSLTQICRYHINNPFHGEPDQSTCFTGTSIRISLQSGAAIQSVEYNYLLDEKQLPDTLQSLRRLFQLIPYSAN